MATIALEGVGGSITFGTSVYASDQIKITFPTPTRETLDTTHLGTVGAKTSKPARLKDVGSIEVEFDHNPEAYDLLDGDPETITINYPLRTGQTTPTRWVMSGYAVSVGGEEMAVDAKMVTKVTIKVTGDITITPAT
jgi:hypothetical protein